MGILSRPLTFANTRLQFPHCHRVLPSPLPQVVAIVPKALSPPLSPIQPSLSFAHSLILALAPRCVVVYHQITNCKITFPAALPSSLARRLPPPFPNPPFTLDGYGTATPPASEEEGVDSDSGEVGDDSDDSSEEPG